MAHGYALALPVFGRREAPSSGGGHNFFYKASSVTIYLPLGLWQPAIGMGHLVA